MYVLSEGVTGGAAAPVSLSIVDRQRQNRSKPVGLLLLKALGVQATHTAIKFGSGITGRF